MNDFASAAMVRVLAEGMRRLGFDPPPDLEPRVGGGARIALDVKRSLVASAIGQGGWACLALLGQGLQRYRDDPVHQALTSARSAAELFARWQRLERYVHSRHRLAVEAIEESAGGGAAVLVHAAAQEPAPLAAESLVVLGVLAALLQALGLEDVEATVDGAVVLPAPDAPALERVVHAGRTARWQLAWRGSAGRPGTASGEAANTHPDALLLADGGHGWPPVARDAARWLVQELAHPPSVGALAARLGVSARTLQRGLRDAGTSYSALLATLRCRASAWWLLHRELPVAEVGFLTGYSDQSHFSRQFRARVGVPPASFRQAFRAGPPGPAQRA